MSCDAVVDIVRKRRRALLSCAKVLRNRSMGSATSKSWIPCGLGWQTAKSVQLIFLLKLHDGEQCTSVQFASAWKLKWEQINKEKGTGNTKLQRCDF